MRRVQYFSKYFFLYSNTSIQSIDKFCIFFSQVGKNVLKISIVKINEKMCEQKIAKNNLKNIAFSKKNLTKVIIKVLTENRIMFIA